MGVLKNSLEREINYSAIATLHQDPVKNVCFNANPAANSLDESHPFIHYLSALHPTMFQESKESENTVVRSSVHHTLIILIVHVFGLQEKTYTNTEKTPQLHSRRVWNKGLVIIIQFIASPPQALEKRPFRKCWLTHISNAIWGLFETIMITEVWSGFHCAASGCNTDAALL